MKRKQAVNCLSGCLVSLYNIKVNYSCILGNRLWLKHSIQFYSKCYAYRACCTDNVYKWTNPRTTYMVNWSCSPRLIQANPSMVSHAANMIMCMYLGVICSWWGEAWCQMGVQGKCTMALTAFTQINAHCFFWPGTYILFRMVFLCRKP